MWGKTEVTSHERSARAEDPWAAPIGPWSEAPSWPRERLLRGLRPSLMTQFVPLAVIAGLAAVIVTVLSWYSHTISVVFAEALTGDYRSLKVNGAGVSQTASAGRTVVVHTGSVTVRRTCVVLWSTDGGTRLLLGRVVGVPGDTVNAPSRRTLAVGEYWVRLDRFHPGAVDSTAVGPVTREAIIGVAEYKMDWTRRLEPLRA